jgi:hypothetical protein
VVRQLRLDEGKSPITPAALLANHVRVEDVWGRDLLRVHVTLPDPRLAADVANALAESAARAKPEQNAPQDVLTTDTLRRQRDYALERLRHAEASLGAAGDRTVAESEHTLRLDIEIEAEQAAIAKAELELRKTPAEQSAAWTPRRAMLNEEIVRRRTRLSGLQRERAIRTRPAAFSSSSRDREESPGQPTPVSTHVDYEVARQVYSAAAARYEEAVVRQYTDRVRVEVLERAEVPEAPVPRGRGASTALGALAGLILCGGVLAIRDLIPASSPKAG